MLLEGLARHYETSYPRNAKNVTGGPGTLVQGEESECWGSE